MKRTFITILILFSGLKLVHGQDVTVNAVFDTSKILIGDQIYYSVSVEQPAGMKLELKTISDTICKNIEILDGPYTDTSSLENNRIKIISKYLVTSFDSGYYEAPPVFAEIRDDNGIRRFYSDHSPLEVMRVNIAPPDTTAKIFDIIGPYGAPLTLGEMLPWILLFLITVALVLVFVRLFKKLRKTRTGTEQIINPDPAHIIAFRELEILKTEKLWERGEIKQYYSRLTEILRTYIGNRYGVYSLEMTTSETLDALLRKGFKKDESFMVLKNILNGADLVKFAKYKPEPEENENHFRNSWSFVDITKMEVQVISGNDNKADKKEDAI